MGLQFPDDIQEQVGVNPTMPIGDDTATQSGGFVFPDDTQEFVKTSTPKASIEPTDSERFSAGLGEFQAGLRKNVVAPINKLLGFDEESERVLQQAKEQQEYADYIREQSSDSTMQTVGKYVPEVAAGVATKAKALGQGVLEFGLSYSREGDAGKALRDAAIASGFAKAIDLIPAKKTSTGKAIAKIPTEEIKKKTNKIFDNLEAVGAQYVDENARKLVLEGLDLTKDTKEVSNQVLGRLVQMKNRARTVKNELYRKADEIADTTATVDSSIFAKSALVDSRGTAITPSQLAGDELDTFKKITALLERNNVVTARGIEDKLQDLKRMKKSSDDSMSPLYERVIESMEAKQDELLDSIGSKGIYNPAREADMAYKREYMGKIDGFGVEGGAKIHPVLKAKNNYEVSKKLLNGTIDPNLAEQIGKKFSSSTKRDMFFDILTDGIEKQALDTTEGVSSLISNFGKINPKGAELMLGKKGYETLKTNMETLGFVQSRIDLLSKTDQGIAKEVTNLIAGAAAVKISPFASIHVAINAGKAIANKKILKGKARQLVKRVKTMEDGSVKRRLLNGLSFAVTPLVGDLLEPKIVDLEKEIEKSGLNGLKGL